MLWLGAQTVSSGCCYGCVYRLLCTVLSICVCVKSYSYVEGLVLQHVRRWIESLALLTLLCRWIE